jgi:NAD(P)-dependent dehydrogenase (short-subunit alcohol dehydrogenase family)
VSAPILVTGAASGIGLALVDRLRHDGHVVIGWDMGWSDANADGILVDVSDEESILAASADLPERLAGVVTCAGVSSRTSLVDTPIEEFRRVIDVNLVGTAAVAQIAHSRLAGGVFVAIGSVAATVPLARRAAYCASKAGVVMLARVLGSEWAADDIQVLCVSPGFVNTGMATRGAQSGGTDLARVLDRTPTGALVPTDDLIDVLVLAVTGGLPGVVGSEIIVDSGYVSGTPL